MKPTYTNLMIHSLAKENKPITTVVFSDIEVQINKRLYTDALYDAVMVAIQKSIEDGYINEIKAQAYFNLNLIYLMTNISFTEKQKENELKLIDEIYFSGFWDIFVQSIGGVTYNKYRVALLNTIEKVERSMQSAATILKTLSDDLPASAQAAADIVNSFDKEKFGEVVQFAEAANGGRPIPPTGKPITDMQKQLINQFVTQ